MATVHELHAYRLIDRAREKEVRVEYHEPDYSVNQKIRDAGATRIYIPIMSYILMGMFAIIAGIAWFSGETPDSTALPAAPKDLGETNG